MTERAKLTGVLSAIVARKRRENERRHRLVSQGYPYQGDPAEAAGSDRAERARVALQRPAGEPPRVIAEIKFRSPSAGVIRTWSAGEAVRVARAYGDNGAAAISVLADRVGFMGTPLDVRRVSQALTRPVLFKEFVLDDLQVDLARVMGASLVLLLVRALSQSELVRLVRRVKNEGMEPVVEAADIEELERALATEATVIGVNARDLRTFRVDRVAAEQWVERIPSDRIAVYMSGIRSADDFRAVAGGRADAVLVGEGLMRVPDPGRALRDMVST